MQILVLISTVGASPQIAEILPPCDFFDCPVLSFFRSYAQVEPLDRFSRFMAQMTCFRARWSFWVLEQWDIWGKYAPKTPKKWA